MFPRALALYFAITLLCVSAAAQSITRPRQVSNSAQTNVTLDEEGNSRLENDVFVVSSAPPAVERAPHAPSSVMPRGTANIEQMLQLAIDSRLGIPYRMGATGPNRYDCSGFVWSVFQSAGISFERSTARSLWSRFAPASEDEKRKFGTLVFFNDLHHVGIVADENGFYHASTSQGVVYSPFNEYWLKRLDGFRRIPLQQALPFVASANPATSATK